jgi:hypothetical protein
MDEILKKLLESEVLSEDTKAVLTEQFNTAVAAHLAEERIKLEAQLTEEFVRAHNELSESINTRIDEFLVREMTELRDDIENHRDLEVEAAEREVELREQMAEQLQEEIAGLVDKIDAFLELQCATEFNELKEDIDAAKRNMLGQKIFESFEETFKAHRNTDLSKIERELAEANDKLADAETRLAESEKAKLAEARSAKMEEALSALSGNSKEQMRIILSNVATERLSEAYKVYLPRILKESAAVKADTKLTEQKVPTTVVTGNEEDKAPVVVEKPSNDSLARMKRLAGLI